MSASPINNSFENSHPLTSKIVPWSNYKGLTTTQKIGKIISDIFKTIICCSIIVPLTTLLIDHFIKKIDKASANNKTEIISRTPSEEHILEVKKLEETVDSNDLPVPEEKPSDPVRTETPTVVIEEKAPADKDIPHVENLTEETHLNSAKTSPSTAIKTLRNIHFIWDSAMLMMGAFWIAQGIGLVGHMDIPYSRYMLVPGGTRSFDPSVPYSNCSLLTWEMLQCLIGAALIASTTIKVKV